MKPLPDNSMPVNIKKPVIKPVIHKEKRNTGLKGFIDELKDFLDDVPDGVKKTTLGSLATSGAVGAAKSTLTPKILKAGQKIVQIFFKFLKRYNKRKR